MNLDRIRKFFGKVDEDRPQIDAQTYADAVTENAMRSTDKATQDMEEVRHRSVQTNERLSEGIERMRNAIPRATLLDSLIADAKGLHR